MDDKPKIEVSIVFVSDHEEAEKMPVWFKVFLLVLLVAFMLLYAKAFHGFPPPSCPLDGSVWLD